MLRVLGVAVAICILLHHGISGAASRDDQPEAVYQEQGSAADIQKKLDALQQQVDEPVVLSVVKRKIGKDKPAYIFKLLADPETNWFKRIIISESASKVVIQDLVVEDDIEDMDSPPDNNYFDLEDINFDGYKDIRLLIYRGMTGNEESSYWLFNPETNKFVYNKDFNGLGTHAVDAGKRQIYSHSNGGHAGMIYFDSIYEVRDNKPVLIREVSQEFDDKEGLYVEVTSEPVNGEMKVTGRRIVPAE